VDFCQRRKEAGATVHTPHPVVVRKTFREPETFKRESVVLARCKSTAKKASWGGGMFPTVLARDDDAMVLWMTHCGEPISSDTIPRDCRAQVVTLLRVRASRLPVPFVCWPAFLSRLFVTLLHTHSAGRQAGQGIGGGQH